MIPRIAPSLFFFCLLFLQAGCSTTKSASDAGTRDGSSFEKAIVVNSIGEEYNWVKEHHPESRVQMQSLIFKGKRPYDVLTFTLADGTTQKFYFDISKFYGKGF